MSESTTTTSTAAIYDDSSRYWKLCSIVLGVGFVIAVASHSGPASASANDANLLTQHQTTVAQQAGQALSIGGFDSIEGEPMFIILNEQGQRVGTLPMSAANAD